MWICPKCEAMNKGSVCDICGEKKPISEKKKKKIAEKEKREKQAAKHGKAKKKTMSLKKKIILWVVCALVTAGLIVGGIFLYRALTHVDTVESVIAESRLAMADVSNLHFAGVTSLNIDYGGKEEQIAQSSVDMNVDFKNNTRFMTVGRNENGEQMQSQAYTRLGADNKIEYYMGDGNNWLKMDNADTSQLEVSSDLSRDFDVYFNAILDSGTAGMERRKFTEDEFKDTDLADKEYFIIDSQVYIDSMEAAETFGVSSYITELVTMSEGVFSEEELLTVIGPVYLTLYIDCETYLPMSCIVDMKKSISAMYLNCGLGDIVVNEAYNSMIYNKFNQVGDVVIPENVLNAKSYSEAAASMPQ